VGEGETVSRKRLGEVMREGETEESRAMRIREGNTVDAMMGMVWLLERRNYFSSEIEGKGERMGEHRERIQGGEEETGWAKQLSGEKRKGQRFGVSRHKCAPCLKYLPFYLEYLMRFQ
jgi:hypothetical protein